MGCVFHPGAPLLTYSSPPYSYSALVPTSTPAAVRRHKAQGFVDHTFPQGVFPSTNRPLERPPDHIGQEMVTVAAVTRTA